MRSCGFGPLAPFDTSVALAREPRACHARHLPASAFRTLSPAYTPQHRPGLFHPGNAPEVSPSGLRTSPGSRAPLGAAALMPFPSPPSPLSDGDKARLQSFHLPGEFVPRRSENLARPLPSWRRAPSRLSRSPPRGRIRSPTRSRGATPRPIQTPMHFALRRVLRSIARRKPWLSPLARRRPSWGFSPRPARGLANPCGCR